MVTVTETLEQQRSTANPEGADEIRFDLVALEAAATRTDAGPDAVVSRAFIRDVWTALLNPTRIRLLRSGEAATPMVIA